MGRKRVNDVVIVHTAWQNKLEGASNMSETRAEQTQDTRVELPMVLTVAELIKVLRISKGAAYALIRSGQIKALPIPGRIRISKYEVLRYLGGPIEA
ncbi:hypothetical protein B5G34_06190 [Flavonifractor sp. An82]|nr:hypothetical protein B5G34_06190 [Flavonifractor sp. An82]